MRHRACLLLMVCMGVVLIAGTAVGFDGQRKGFVLGGGLGFAPAAKFSISGHSETNAGVAAHFVIGYAWDNENMIVYEGNVAGYNLDLGWAGDRSVGQGFNGASYYHYFKPRGPAPFLTGGIGFYVFQIEDAHDQDPGAGALLGGGYAFTRHFQVGGYFSFGRSKWYGDEFGHNHFSILVSGIAF